MRFPDPDDLPARPVRRETFRELISRRDVLKSGLGLTAAMFLGLPVSSVAEEPPAASRIGFGAVGASTGDAVVVPEGYEAYAIAPWGSPLFGNSPAWRPDGGNTGADQALQVGDNHDGMTFIPLADGEGVLVVNHEYANYEYLFAAEAGQKYPEPWTADKVLKAQNAHGVSILHLRRAKDGRWEVVVGSPRNRRITPHTPMEIAGPAAGHALMKTSADPDGTRVLGTFNNCANGWTPWGTYLACEENFNFYFGTSQAGAVQTPIQKSYGIEPRRSLNRWEDHDPRFDVVKEPNECHRFGWVVELDPHDAAFVPRKRTALGRIKHENAAVTLAPDRRVVVYMGDDQRNEYIYKFVSEGKYDPSDPNGNRSLLDGGRLYVARFTDGDAKGDLKGAGEWLPLDRDANPALKDFASQAEVLIRARDAADAAGATPMDRPEWVAVHPETGDVYCTLTNNTDRTAPDPANPRERNIYGQIVRWREKGGDAASVEPFTWELFVLAGHPDAHAGTPRGGSANVNLQNMFNSPDGIGFSPDGLLWIQTDGDFSNAGDFIGQGNNQMLCADPKTGEIRRFLVGPSGCEITGQAFAPDQKTLFISVQHPGEPGNHPRAPKVAREQLLQHLADHPTEFSGWPDPAGGRPRSAIVVVARKDGGVVGR